MHNVLQQRSAHLCDYLLTYLLNINVDIDIVIPVFHFHQYLIDILSISNSDIQARPPGIPVREFPDPNIPGGNSREFLKFWRELRGISQVLFFQFLLLIMTF